MQPFKAAALFAAGVLTASTVGFDDCQTKEQQGNRTFAVSSRMIVAFDVRIGQRHYQRFELHYNK